MDRKIVDKFLHIAYISPTVVLRRECYQGNFGCAYEYPVKGGDPVIECKSGASAVVC